MIKKLWEKKKNRGTVSAPKILNMKIQKGMGKVEK